MIVLAYRQLIEKGDKIESIRTTGYCQVCRAKPEDLKEQKKILVVEEV